MIFLFTWKCQWDFIHDPEGGWHIFEDVGEGESGVIVNKSKIMAVLDTLKNAYANGNSQVSYNYSTSILYHSSVALGDADPIQIQIEFYPRNQEVKINPGLYMENPEENIYQQQGDFTSLRFEGIGTGGHDVLHIDVDSDNVDVLKNYLYGRIYQTFELDSISQEVEEVIDDIESDSLLDALATCNLCVRRAFRRITLTDVLYPIHLNNYNGKITALGKANDIYCDFLRWYHNDSYLSIQQTYVDPLIEDNIQIAQEFDSAGYANILVEDFRSDLEITEFESIEKDLTVEHGGDQYSIPDYNSLQDLADQGSLIIGVRKNESQGSDGHYSSGHVVVLLPYNEEDNQDLNTTRNSMQTIYSGITIDYPFAMECGGDQKRQGWIGTESFLNMKWYIYK